MENNEYIKFSYFTQFFYYNTSIFIIKWNNFNFPPRYATN